MSFKRTTAVNKLVRLKKRKRVVQGGTWAGKTYAILAYLINKSIINPKQKTTIVAETIPAIKEGALANFTEIMEETGRWDDVQYNATERTYTFTNGSKMQFTSFDTIGKAKSAGKRHNLFINEANYIPFAIADALMMRTSKEIWIDFNPVEEFWAHTEILTQEDAEFLLLKYTDNEAIPESIVQELRMKLEKAKTSGYWENWCKVYIHGEVGTLEGIIFAQPALVKALPSAYKWKIRWIDFGFTNDPTTIGETRLSEGGLHHHEYVFRTGMTNGDISKALEVNGVMRHIDIIVADSAEPKSIAELRRMGWNVIGAEKPKGSVNAGIDLMKRYPHHVTEGSKNIINEFRKYSWEVDRATGKPINVPVDTFNHCIDPIRYAVSYKFGRPIISGAPRAIVTKSRH